jgi:ribosome-associated protein
MIPTASLRIPTIEARVLAALIARLADEKKAEDVQVLAVGERLKVTDYFVLATGQNRNHVRAIQDEIHVTLKRMGERHRPIEGSDLSWWVVLDFVDVVVHILQPEARAYYGLETLYADSERVDWRSITVPEIPAEAAG